VAALSLRPAAPAGDSAAGPGPAAPAPAAAGGAPRAACSGHGLLEDGRCRCDDCYGGFYCEQDVGNCTVMADSGTPYLFEDFWVRPEHAAAAVAIPPHYHIGYGSSVGCSGGGISGAACDSDQLVQAIRRVHRAVGNFDTEGFEVVVGVGSTQLISGALWALALGEPAGAAPTSVWAQAPYYSGYSVAQWWGSAPFRWTEAEPQPSPETPAVEFVTSPNNPDGALRRAKVSGEGAATVFDFAYYWPHFTAIHDRSIELGPSDVALFTLSKSTGHASSRIGWALTRSRAVADKLRQFVGAAGGVPRENQLRAIAVLDHLDGRSYDNFEFARRVMVQRWAELQGALHGNACYAMQELEPAERDAWSGAEKAPTPAYLWMECLRAEDCLAELQAHGIAGRGGPKFGAPERFARVELLMNASTFSKLLLRLRQMAAACE